MKMKMKKTKLGKPAFIFLSRALEAQEIAATSREPERAAAADGLRERRQVEGGARGQKAARRRPLSFDRPPRCVDPRSRPKF